METAAAETEARAPEYDVFISHSSHDKAVADAMVAALEGRGIRCWIAPRDILPGREWADAILAGIHACRVMVLVLSAQANQSSQVPREVERAVHRHMAIVPFRIENVEPSGSLEYFLSTPHWLDAITPPLEPHLVRLAETVRRLLGAADTTVDGSGTASAGTGGVAIGETPTGGGGRRVERWVRPVGVRRVGRVTLVSLAFIAAIAAQYALANFPVAVDVEKYNPMVAREGEEL